MQLIRPDFTNFCDNDTTFVILLLTTICETTHEQCRGLASHLCSPAQSYDIRTTFGTLFQNIVCFLYLVTNWNHTAPNGTSRAPSPTILPWLHHAAKSLCSLRIYVVIGDRIGGADFCSVITFDKKHNFCVLFLIISAPSRLSPNEALPQTPLGALPLDPTSPLAPGLSVRFISRLARCLGAALLIPHSSLLT